MHWVKQNISIYDELTQVIDSQIADGLITCAACGSVAGTKFCRGNRRPFGEKKVEVDEESLFEIASVSKLFVASIAALLYCEGRLDIDAPFTKYMPEHILAKTGTDITIRDLATHTSGYDGSWMAQSGIYAPKFPFASDTEYIDAFLKALPTAKRGEKYCYACYNFILLGFIVEKILGMDLDWAARKYVWEPLGMRDISWRNCIKEPRTVQMFTNGPCWLGTKGDENARGLKRPIGNAGIFTNLRTILVFAKDMLTRHTFPNEYYDLLFTQTATFGRDSRSFGWNMSLDGIPPGWSEKTIFHTGYTGQIIAVDPESGNAGAALTNLIPSDQKLRAPAYAARRKMLALICGCSL